MKKRVRLTESDLHRIVKESVRRVMVNEIGDTERGQMALGRAAGRESARGHEDYAEEIYNHADEKGLGGTGNEFFDAMYDKEAEDYMTKDDWFMEGMMRVYRAYLEHDDFQIMLEEFEDYFGDNFRSVEDMRSERNYMAMRENAQKRSSRRLSGWRR
jgi:hypothetical protein